MLMDVVKGRDGPDPWTGSIAEDQVLHTWNEFASVLQQCKRGYAISTEGPLYLRV